MTHTRILFKISVVFVLSLALVALLSSSAEAQTDPYMNIGVHFFTLSDSNGTCVDFFDTDIGQTRNCDPINLIFPGRTWEQVSQMLEDVGWSTCCEGTPQSLHYDDGAGPYAENEQLVYPNTFGDRYHIRLWQAPGETLVTFAAVHHEELVFLSHVIDMSWEDAEADLASVLCSPDCEQTGPLETQRAIQLADFGNEEIWRGFHNNGSATVIPAPPTSNAPPTASFTFGCAGLACTFDASASSDPDGTITNYAWDFGDFSSGSGVITNHTFAAAGTYNVTLTTSDDEGATDANMQSVTVNDTNYLPLVSFTVTCTGLNCDFDASASSDPDGTIVDYAWDFGDSNSGNGVITGHTYAGSNTYNVTLTATDNENGIGSDSQNVTVVDEPASAVHVGGLEGVSIVKKTWRAEVTITVHDESERPVANAAVSGDWSGDTVGPDGCTTGSDGRCTVVSDEMPKKNTDHVIFTVTDVQGNSSDAVIQVNKDETTLILGQPPGGAIILSAVGYKVKGIQHVDLDWTGMSPNVEIDIFRDDILLDTLSSKSTSYDDNIDLKGGGSYLYQVCQAGTAVCSEAVNVSF